MAGHSFKLQKGALSPEDDAFIRSKRKRVPKFTAIAHGFIAFTAILGIAFSALAYFISNERNTISRRPEESLGVTLSLLASIIWPGIYLLFFENFSECCLGLVCTAHEVVMIVVLIYLPTVSATTLSHTGPEGICGTFMILGLVCAYLVALLHLVQVSVRVMAFIINLAQGPKSSPLAKRLYKKGYSTRFAIYIISTCLSLMGFSMMVWSHGFLSMFTKKDYHSSDMYAAYTFAVFDVFDALAILHFTVPLWLLANIYSMILSSKAIPTRFAAIYDSCLGIGILAISTRCLIFLNNLSKVCPNSGRCLGIWTEVRPGQIASIVLGFIVGLIHTLVCLFTCVKLFHVHLKNTNRRNSFTHRLNSSNFSDVSFLHNHTWTDDEVLSIFRIKGLTDEARDKIVSMLYKIHNDDVSQAQRISDGFCGEEKSSLIFGRISGEKDPEIKV